MNFIKILILISFFLSYSINLFSQVIEIDSIFTFKYKYEDCTLYWNDTLAISKQTKKKEIDTLQMSIIEDEVDGEFSEPYHFESAFKLLSIVGPYISFWSSYLGSGGSSAHPSYGTSYCTYNIENPKLHLLSNIFDETVLLEELLQEKIIKEHLFYSNQYDTPSIKNLEELLKYLDHSCDSVQFNSLLNDFAFYDVVGDDVIIQFGLMHCSEAYRGFFTEFNISLPIPEDKKELFKKAKLEKTLLSNWKY